MSNGDLWRTPQQVIDYIENRFGEIQLDLCASEDGHVCSSYITEKENFLDDDVLYKLDDLYHGSLCWMNPPYSNPLPFVQQIGRASCRERV